MHYFKKLFSVESASAILAWLVVSVAVIALMYNAEQYSIFDMGLASVCLIIFIACFLISVSDHSHDLSLFFRIGLMTVQYVSVLAVAWLMPFSFIAILITIWSSQLPFFVSFKTAVFTSPFWSAPLWLIFAFHWEVNYWLLSALLFWTFNIFALVMVNSMIKQQKAKEAADELNRELIATQALLGQAAKQAERVRIARNIHDLLGHHLTALTINLQVASRITEGEAQQKVQQCHDLAKLLLSDVREAVSEIRDKSTIELQQALQGLFNNVPNLQVQLNIQPEIAITDVNLAETILRCVQEGITNTLKHSNAKNFTIELAQKDHWISLEMQDDGRHKNSKAVTEGNGILGMRERISILGGEVQAALSATGFTTLIRIPEGAL